MLLPIITKKKFVKSDYLKGIKILWNKILFSALRNTFYSSNIEKSRNNAYFDQDSGISDILYVYFHINFGILSKIINFVHTLKSKYWKFQLNIRKIMIVTDI